MRTKVFILLLQALVMFCGTVKAKIYTGLWGSCRYSIDTKDWTLIISGDGSMADNLSLMCSRDSIRNVVIMPGVTSIGAYAFYNCSRLTTINIPSTVTSIGDFALNSCISLTSITIPSSVTSIGQCAFWKCSSLTSLTIPSSVTSIGDQAFSWCSNMTSITIPSSVTSIGSEAFNRCYISQSNLINESNINLKSRNLTICDEETEEGLLIKDNTLVKARTNTKTATIPSHVTQIGIIAFSDCIELTSISIPSSVTRMQGYDAFAGCYISKSNLTNDSDIDLSKYGLTICDEETEEGLLIKDNTLVKARKNTKTATIPSYVTKIKNEAFSDCIELNSISIPSSVTSIGSTAFRYGIYDRYIPTANFTNESNIKAGGIKLYDIKTDDGLVIYNNAIIDVHLINSNDTTINIPSSVTSIEEYAFSNCSWITTVNIPSSVTKIDDYAFTNCSRLATINIPSSVTKIGSYAFHSCGFTSINIPSSVTKIGERAFSSCKLTSINIPSSVTEIGDYAFAYCSRLASINIPSSVTRIGTSTFKSCYISKSNLINETDIDLSKCGLTICDEETEEGLLINGNTLVDARSDIKKATIPSYVTSIGESALKSCKSLESIIVESSRPAKIYDNTFDSEVYDRAILYVPTGSENTYYAAPGWINFKNILTYDPTKNTCTLKIKHGNFCSTTHDVQSSEQFSVTLDKENVRKVSYNGKDVTKNVLNGKYVTPAITTNSELVIEYKSVPTNDDIDGDGNFTISDITELIKHYLETSE